MSLKFFCRTHKKEEFLFYIQKVMCLLAVTLTEVTKGSKGCCLIFCRFCHCHYGKGHVCQCAVMGPSRPKSTRVRSGAICLVWVISKHSERAVNLHESLFIRGFCGGMVHD